MYEIEKENWKKNKEASSEKKTPGGGGGCSPAGADMPVRSIIW